MIRNKIASLWCQSPSAKAKNFTQGFGVDLSHTKGIFKMDIKGYAVTAAVTGEPYKTTYVGEPTEDGRYEFPIHCHGESILSGEALAAAVLAAAEKSSTVTASLEGNILTFSSKSTVALFPEGILRGATGEIFTVMFRFCAPENSGSSVASGLSLAYTYGSQALTYSETYAAETVQILATSNSTRRLNGLSLVSTSGLPRQIDISTFGIFRGTVGEEHFTPYWGEKTTFYLSEPLRIFNTSTDIACPLQGYAERHVRATPLLPDSAIKEEISSSYPVYRLPLPTELFHQSVNLDRFYASSSVDMLIGGSLRYMIDPDGESVLLTGTSSLSTVEKFLNYFNALRVNVISARGEPLIERFDPITLPTRRGRNYVELQTKITPQSIKFTYL